MIKNYTDDINYCPTFKWIDVSSPSNEELQNISEEYLIEIDVLSNCLSPIHYPKIQDKNGYFFIVLRSYDESSQRGDVVQDYTNKVIVFINEKYLITIHRNEHAIFSNIKQYINYHKEFFKHNKSYDLLIKIIKIVTSKFEVLLDKNQLLLDKIESNRVSINSPVGILNDIHYIKRSTSIAKRTLWQSHALVQNLFEYLPEFGDKIMNVVENLNRLHSLSEEIELHAQNIVSLHISLASQKTAEIMRTLAIFSVFFMPLTFIAGLYGMNFKNMPELNWEYGYPTVLLLMILVSIFLFLWFKKKGWYKTRY